MILVFYINISLLVINYHNKDLKEKQIYLIIDII